MLKHSRSYRAVLGLFLACLVLVSAAWGEPVHEAASSGSVVSLEKILTDQPEAWRRLDVNGLTPLILAIKENHPEAIAFLLAHGADPNQTTPQNWSPLHEAAVTGKPDIVAMLLEKGAKPKTKEKQNGGTALHIACFQGNITVCELLIKGGADLNLRDREGYTPLFHAKDQGHWELVKRLKARGAR